MLKVKCSNPSLSFLGFLSKKLESFGVDFYFEIQEQALLVDEVGFLNLPLHFQRFLKSRESFG